VAAEEAGVEAEAEEVVVGEEENEISIICE